MSRTKGARQRGRKWKRDEAPEQAVRGHRPIADKSSLAPPVPEAQEVVIVPGRNWPHRDILIQHSVYHPAPGAVPENRGRQCPSCGTWTLWDPNNEAYGPHTVEQCGWNQAYNERQEQRERHPRLTGPWSMGF